MMTSYYQRRWASILNCYVYMYIDDDGNRVEYEYLRTKFSEWARLVWEIQHWDKRYEWVEVSKVETNS